MVVQQRNVGILEQKRFVETIRERSDLVSLASEYLLLKKSGQNYTGLCPFHTEKNPSFTISSGRQLFHCFGCGAGGDIFQFLMRISGVSFPEALSQLAKRAGIVLPSHETETRPVVESTITQIGLLNQEVADYFHQNLLRLPEAAVAMAYLAARGITLPTIQKFLIGYAPPGWNNLLNRFSEKFSSALLSTAGFIARETPAPGATSSSGGRFYDRFRNRIIFPIQTLQGKIVGFGGRVLDDAHPKYLNTPETPVFTKGKHLFGLDQFHRARGAPTLDSGSSSLIVVEGYFDVMAAHQAGVCNVVGTLGTALTAEHLSLARRVSEKVVLLFDPDSAGVRAAQRGAALCLEKGTPVQIATLPEGEDPDLYIRRHGPDHFLQKIQEAVPALAFFIRHATPKTTNPAALSIEEKARAMEEIFPLIRQLKTKIEQSHYLKMFADLLAVSEEDVRAEFSRHVSRPMDKPHPAVPPSADAPFLAQDEALLLTLLLQNKRPPSDLNPQLCLDDFTNPQVKSILKHFWDEADGVWRRWADLAGLSDRVDAEVRPLLTRLSVAPVPYDEKAEDVLRDCITSLRKRRLQQEGKALQHALRLAERARDLSQVRLLQQRFFHLKKEFSHLAVSDGISVDSTTGYPS